VLLAGVVSAEAGIAAKVWVIESPKDTDVGVLRVTVAFHVSPGFRGTDQLTLAPLCEAGVAELETKV